MSLPSLSICDVDAWISFLLTSGSRCLKTEMEFEYYLSIFPFNRSNLIFIVHSRNAVWVWSLRHCDTHNIYYLEILWRAFGGSERHWEQWEMMLFVNLYKTDHQNITNTSSYCLFLPYKNKTNGFWGWELNDLRKTSNWNVSDQILRLRFKLRLFSINETQWNF